MSTSSLFSLRARAKAVFKGELSPLAQQRRNQKKWIRSVALLGNRHLLAVPVRRLDQDTTERHP